MLVERRVALLSLVGALLVCSPSGFSLDQRGRIRILLIGHVVRSYNPVTTFLDPDPSVTYNIVPTSEANAVPLGDAEARRCIKQYFPRD